MRFTLPLLGLAAFAITVSAQAEVMKNITIHSNNQWMKKLENRTQGCTKENVGVRKEWGSMSKKDRLAFIDAVLCLQSKPSIAAPGLVPGARSRFDDFQAVHINQTFLIHFNAKLLPWHRYFLWVYEKALREECGYQGYHPYWDWSKWANDTVNSPIFDGSSTSLSGQGVYIPGRGDYFYRIPRTGDLNLNITIPAGPGGGCVQGGPFANQTVNLGPVNSAGSLPGWIGDGSGLDYNPRCLTRDINSFWAVRDLNYAKVQSAIVDTDNFAAFSQRYANPGLHSSGHFTIGGMNNDLFISPGDPAFYFHHAQVDRVWTLWQGRDLAQRENELMGTTTWFNTPPSANITLSEPIDMGYLYETREVRYVMSTVDNDFCYIYE